MLEKFKQVRDIRAAGRGPDDVTWSSLDNDIITAVELRGGRLARWNFEPREDIYNK